MTVLVLGAKGFLGSAVLGLLKENADEVLPISRTPADGYESCDITNTTQLMYMLNRFEPTVIVNAAVEADFAAPVRQLFAANVLAPALVASWCTKRDAYFIQVSGAIVHGSEKNHVGPDVAIEPNSGYGRSKFLADELCLASGARCAIIRFGGIFGKLGPDHLSLNRAIRAAAQGTPPTIVGDGSARRNYVHVDDAAGALVSCLEQQLVGTYYYAGPEALTIAQMMGGICSVYMPGVPPSHSQGPEAHDQIVDVSRELPPARPFRITLESERNT